VCAVVLLCKYLVDELAVVLTSPVDLAVDLNRCFPFCVFGENFNEIHYSSDFIPHYGELIITYFYC